MDALVSQTRPIDRIVVILDNCTDGTETIVRRYKGVTVQKTFGNIDKKVGALTQGWQRWAADYDFVLGVDGDTMLANDALEPARSRDAPGSVRRRRDVPATPSTSTWARHSLPAN